MFVLVVYRFYYYSLDLLSSVQDTIILLFYINLNFNKEKSHDLRNKKPLIVVPLSNNFIFYFFFCIV